MASVNKVIIVGNLGRDPEIRYMPSGDAIANIAVATSYKSKDRQTGEQKELTEWHRISFFGRLAEIKEALGEDYPLVLHGGSGAGDDNFRRAVEGGINKINLWTDYSAAYVSALRANLAENERPDYLLLSVDAEEKATEWLARYMRLFGSSGRYQFGEGKMEETD